MKTACIYHSIDLDGWMSAAIVKHWWKSLYYDVNNVHYTEENGSLLLRGNFSNEEQERLDFIGYNYGQPVPDLSAYNRVIMCDISFPKEEMTKLATYKDFTWLDHHISAIKENNHLIEAGSLIHPHGKLDTKFAACELTWKYFFPNEPMPEIVRLLGRYDCFGHKGTDEERKVLEFQYGARAVISNYEAAYDYLNKSLQGIVTYDYIGQYTIEDRLLEQGKSIYSYLITDAKQSYKNGFEIKLVEEITDNIGKNIVNRKFICINKERFNPINFDIDYHKDSYDGAMCFHIDSNKIVNVSLYNDNGEVDCSQIAKQFGGGGHKGAAGFRITLQQFTELIL